jgi:hypothetical protein
MEYALNALNVVSQLTAPAARGLEDALSRAVNATAPLQRFGPDTWLPPGVPSDISLVFMIGGAIVGVGYLVLRRV